MAIALFDYNTNTFLASLPMSAITGTTTNDNAAVGAIGEYFSTVVASVNAAANNTYQDTTTMSLTPGDWDVQGIFAAARNGSTWTFWEFGISAGTAGNTYSDNVQSDNRNDIQLDSSHDNYSGCIASWRVSLAATTTMRAKNYYLYSAGTPRSFCRLSARRVR